MASQLQTDWTRSIVTKELIDEVNGSYVMGASQISVSRRLLFRCIDVLCKARGVHLTSLDDGWTVILEYSGQRELLIGSSWSINSAASASICRDKVATCSMLRHASVPHIPHTLALHPSYGKYMKKGESSWTQITAFGEKNDWQVVLKPRDGSQGKGVMRARTRRGLEQCALELMSDGKRAIALCPFVDIEHEYRCLVLDKEVLLVFCKVRPGVVGDGVSSVEQLANATGAVRDEKTNDDIDWNRVPAKGERVVLGWMHNLQAGAKAVEVPLDHPQRRALEETAIQAAAAVGIRFASVDLVTHRAGANLGLEAEEVKGGGVNGVDGGSLASVADSAPMLPIAVMEVNSGVHLTKFAKFRGVESVVRIFDRLLCAMFGERSAA